MTDKPALVPSKKRGPAKSDKRKFAESMGMSRYQMWRAVTLASIPSDIFEALIEGGACTSRLIEVGRYFNGLPPSKPRPPRRHSCPHCGGDLSQ